MLLDVGGGEGLASVLKVQSFLLKRIRFAPWPDNMLNQSLVRGKFPDSLKLAIISPFYKGKDPLDKTNYRPVSVLPLLS